MKAYKLIKEVQEDSITLVDGTVIVPCELSSLQEDSVNKAVDFWNLERTNNWRCDAINDNGIDDSKESVEIEKLSPENVIVSNDRAIGYYIKYINKWITFASYSNKNFNYAMSKVDESYVPCWGDITEYDEYRLVLRNGKEEDVYIWNLNNDKKVVINDEAVCDFSDYGSIKEVEEIEILEGATLICEKAFSNCERLVKITIPSTVESIGEQAFENCISLKEVIIKNGVKHIGKDSFKNCKSLEELVLPNSVKVVGGNRLFYGCTSLTKLTFSKCIDYIDHFTHDEDGGTCIECYTTENLKNNAYKTLTQNGKLYRYTSTSKELELISQEIKKWEINKKEVLNHYNYGTEEQIYFSKKEENLKLLPQNMIIQNGEVVGYRYTDEKSAGYDYCFFFNKYNEENPPVFEYLKSYTIGAYYYNPPHTQVKENYKATLLLKK